MLLEGVVVDNGELLACEEQFRQGFQEQVRALRTIHDRELYRLVGFEHFLDYCKERLDVKRSQAFRLLEFSDALAALGDSPVAKKITHEGIVRPLAGMKAPSKVRVLKTAVAVAEKRGAPLTGKLVQEIAQKNAGWKTRAEYRAEQRQKKERERTPEQLRLRMKEDLELALGVIVGFQKTGWELVQELGDPRQWACFTDALRILKDAEDA